jgi:hypothetical protein
MLPLLLRACGRGARMLRGVGLGVDGSCLPLLRSLARSPSFFVFLSLSRSQSRLGLSSLLSFFFLSQGRFFLSAVELDLIDK